VVRKRLDDYCSLFTAEARAVLRVCQLMRNSKFFSVATGNYIARKIAFLLQAQQKIILVSIPGHSGIPGNDKADLEAKQATTQECGNESQLEFSEFRNAITRHQLTMQNWLKTTK
jgi:hypothetical protein